MRKFGKIGESYFKPEWAAKAIAALEDAIKLIPPDTYPISQGEYIKLAIRTAKLRILDVEVEYQELETGKPAPKL